ncbi:MAG: hypothetical protein KAI66_22690, partial [Lentisphaeria bacterium]|nr:hypothetical protein [Lentisphaeria bacterium]
MRHAHALVIALSVCLCLCASAQDRDGDGLTDEMEERIGMDAGHAETFEEVAKDKTKEQGDPVGKENYAPGLDVVAVHLANVAGNRWVWRIDFLEEIPAKNLNLIIYVQADNDTGTGRRDVHGIDYMVVFSRDSAGLREFTSDGSEIPQRAGGGTVVGRAVYLVADMNLQQVAGRTHCSANVLVETRIPHKTVDSMKRFDIDVAGQNDRPLPKRASDALVSEGVFQTWGMDSMRGVRANSANRVLPIQNCRMHGFVYDHFTEYHMPNARIKESGPYWVEIDIPATGRYHLGFIVYDCAGRQVYRLLLNGKPLGVAVAAAGVNRQTLFASEDAHVLQQGDVFRVQLLNREGNPRIEDLLLLRKLPKRRALARELKHLVGTAVRDEVTGTISGRITFTTNWPAKAVVAYGPDRSFSQSFEEAEAEANHRLFLPGLAPGATCRFRLRVTTPEGETIERKGRFKTTLPVPVGRVERARIALRLRNPQPADASLWPVTQGVPFPQGALGDGRRVRLMMAGGERLPLQTRVSARWPDGSVKWLLVDIQLSVKAKQNADLVLEYGTAIEPLEMTGGISVTETEKEVVIDAGVLTLSLPRRGAVFPAQVRLNGQELLSPALTRVVSDKGEGRSTDVENRIRVIESGPLRTVIRVERTIAVTTEDNFLDSYDLHIYRGLPFFRVFHTWTNSNQASEWSNLHRWVLGARMTLGEGTKIGAGGKTMGPASKGVFLTQVFENERTVMRGSQRSPADSGVPGMLVASGPRGAVSVAVRHFSELYPKKLGMGQEEDGQLVLAVDIMPLIGDKTYAFSKPGKLEDKLFYYLKDGHYRLRQGVSKRHELLFGFDAESAGNLALLLEAPPVLASDPDWYCTSGVFTDVLPSSPELGGIYREYDLATEKSLGAYLERRRTGREYGMLNFGDWWGERGRNWGNIEYDTQHAFYLQFIRSGQLGFLRTGEEACRHNMDVDMVRSHRDSHRVGKVYAHCIGHTGGYYKHAINNQGSPRGGMSITHSWIDGYLDNYFLTGDVRGLESARMLIDNYDHHYLRNYDYNNNRHSGWHLVNTLAMYRATSDPYYLNAARIIMERVSEREMSDGGWTRQLTPGHCLCMPRHRGEAAFMTGILLTGLKDYHEITGDEHVGDMIVRGAKNIIRATWVPERNSM